MGWPDLLSVLVFCTKLLAAAPAPVTLFASVRQGEKETAISARLRQVIAAAKIALVFFRIWVL